MLSSLNISYKLWSIALLAFSGTALIVLFSLISLKTNLLEDRKAEIKYLVESTSSILKEYARKQSNGELSKSQAQAEALQLISTMRYGENGYFWVNDMIPKMLMHPIKPELNGKDLSNSKDVNGKHLFKEMVRVVSEQGSGFVNYYWPKPGYSAGAPKLSYVKGFKEWDLLIGTGIYIDDIDEMNARIASAAEEQTAVANEMKININDINEVADNTAKGSEQMQLMNINLERLTKESHELVKKFTI